MTRRKRTSVAAALAAAALTLAACSSSSKQGSSSGSGASSMPITLGGIFTLSGPFAQIGGDNAKGAELAISEINASGGVLGRHLKLVTKDEQASTTASVADVHELLSSDVDLLMGFTTDSDCLAAAPLVQRGGGVLIGTACQTDELEGAQFVKSFFEFAPNNSMLADATASLAHSNYGSVQTWEGIGPDYTFGHEVWSYFQADLKKLDPSVSFGKNEFVPLTETQFSPYITSLISSLPSDSSSTVGLFASTFSATTEGLAKQGQSYNFFGHYRAVLNLGGSDPTAQQLGAATPKMWFIYDYTPKAYSNSANTKFINDYEKAYGTQPDAWAYDAYGTVEAYAAAIKKAGSASPAKVEKALAGLSFSTPEGTVTFNPKSHLLEGPVTVWEVVGDSSAPLGYRVLSARGIPWSTVSAAAVPPSTRG